MRSPVLAPSQIVSRGASSGVTIGHVTRTAMIMAVLLGGCAERAPEAPAPSPCDGQASAARSRTQGAAAANTSCTSDAECSAVRLVASCFDACYAAVNETGVGAVDRASTLVEAAECRKFHATSCSHESQTCGPAPPVSCQQGVCTLAEVAAPTPAP